MMKSRAFEKCILNATTKIAITIFYKLTKI